MPCATEGGRAREKGEERGQGRGRGRRERSRGDKGEGEERGEGRERSRREKGEGEEERGQGRGRGVEGRRERGRIEQRWGLGLMLLLHGFQGRQFGPVFSEPRLSLAEMKRTFPKTRQEV